MISKKMSTRDSPLCDYHNKYIYNKNNLHDRRLLKY